MQEKERKYLEQHDRLAHLFVTDRFAFEAERKRMIDKTKNGRGYSEEIKEKLNLRQKNLDRALKGAGSPENRFALIQAFFWHCIVNEWQPAFKKHFPVLNSLKKSTPDHSTLSL